MSTTVVVEFVTKSTVAPVKGLVVYPSPYFSFVSGVAVHASFRFNSGVADSCTMLDKIPSGLFVDKTGITGVVIGTELNNVKYSITCNNIDSVSNKVEFTSPIFSSKNIR